MASSYLQRFLIAICILGFPMFYLIQYLDSSFIVYPNFMKSFTGTVQMIELNSTKDCLYKLFRIQDSNGSISTLIYLSFSELIRIPSPATFRCGNYSIDFALVIPDQLSEIGENISSSSVIDLTATLKKYHWLQAISGSSLVLGAEERPACSMNVKEFTVELSEDYSKFEDQSQSISIDQHSSGSRDETELRCFPCDLLPDVFLIKLKTVPGFTKISELKSSGRLPLFLELKNRSAYCPRLRILAEGEADAVARSNFTCNNLRMIWDGNFVLLPKLFGIYRLVFHESTNRSVEHWLGCTWLRGAYQARSPLHCTNWVRQHLFDIVDFIENIGADYRIVFGTLLGGIREHEIIPWTVDADVLPIFNDSSKYAFRDRWRKLIGPRTNYRLSYEDRLRQETLPTLNRAFPWCPLRFTASNMSTNPALIENPQRLSTIKKLIKISNSRNSMTSFSQIRSTGYVDAYYTVHLETLFAARSRNECSKRLTKVTKDYIEIVISGRKFKTFRNYEDILKCWYGENWKEPPSEAKGDWDEFIA